MNILENGTEMQITEAQAKALLQKDLIYDSGDGYYHLTNENWEEVDKEIEAENY